MPEQVASRPASEVPVNPWGPLPAVCCVWCMADLSVEPHAWWCRPEQYRITTPLPSEVRRSKGRTRRR